MNKTLFAAAALLISGAAFATPYELDGAHSAAQFAVKHMMVSTVRGQFQKVAGTADINDADLGKSKIDVTIDAASVDTRIQKRDDHLRSADFFDVAKYPTITFKSTKIQKGADGKLTATGDLTMHGVTKPVTLTIDSLTPATKTPFGTTVRGVSATGKLNRAEFGIGKPGNAIVSEDIDLVIDAELVQQAPAKS